MAAPKPFRISVSDELLDFITQRVKTSRIPPGIATDWSLGVPPSVITPLQAYWRDGYDWKGVEARINEELRMFTLPVEQKGEVLEMHFVHHRSERTGAIPLIFQHGWPGSFLEVERIIGLLTDPPEGEQAYHVVAPSLPGFAFSEGSLREDFSLQDIAAIDHKLMLALGYETYVAQGGDWGSMVVRIMGLDYPESCVGVHVNMVMSGKPSWWRNPLTFLHLIYYAVMNSQDKDTDIGRLLWWMNEESAYMKIQGSKPQTLSYALVDSPLGMLAWIRDKMEPLVGNDFKWEDEEVITWVMMYIIPGTSHHAHIYTNTNSEARLKEFSRFLGDRVLGPDVDFGASIFPKDVLNIPRWWAACTVSSNIIFWRNHDSGGHFAATEKPNELARDIRDFTVLFREGKLVALRESGKLKK